MDGFGAILKVPGPTSHDVVARLRRATASKVGHLGTLDPLAAGVLPVALGRATRFGRYLMGSPKRYRVQVLFGLATSTGDLEGQPLARVDASALEERSLALALSSFRGDMEQTPPMASAVKVGGTRLYTHHRRGDQVQVQARRVSFFGVQLLSFAPGVRAAALIDLQVSAGTYVRRFAEDLGTALGLPATVGMLLRTEAGPFGIDGAQLLGEVEGPGGLRLTGIGSALATVLDRVSLDGPLAGRFVHGGAVALEDLPGASLLAAFGMDGVFLGVGEVSGDGLRLLPRTVLGEEGA